MAFLELQGVSKGFETSGGRAEVLRDIHLSVERGELLALVGPSGVGKSTLMSMIAGLVAPDRGEILLDGKRIRGPGADRGVVFQNYSLLPWLTVLENVQLAVDKVFGTWPSERRRQCAEEHIALVNLTPARHKRPHELSGGMRQRVALARALAMDPEVLLLDEPLSALDALTRASLQDEIERIWRTKKKTVVLITNDVDEGLLLADRIILMIPGAPARLGPAIPVDLERPRRRKELNHDPRFRALRTQVMQALLAQRPRPVITGARTEAWARPASALEAVR